MHFTRVKIITTIPPEHGDAIREVLGNAGAGRIGEYSFCSTSILSKGRFKPSKNASPFIGEANKIEAITEEIIEVTCDRADAERVVTALRAAHPYEEPIVDLIPLLDEGDL